MIVAKAIKNLRPEAQFQLVGDELDWQPTNDANDPTIIVYKPSNLFWYDESVPFPSREELEAEIARLKEEAKGKDYQMRRMMEYPPLSQLADAIFWQAQGDESKMTEYLAAVEAVKQKYPKGI